MHYSKRGKVSSKEAKICQNTHNTSLKAPLKHHIHCCHHERTKYWDKWSSTHSQLQDLSQTDLFQLSKTQKGVLYGQTNGSVLDNQQLTSHIAFLTADKGSCPQVKASVGQRASLAYTIEKAVLPFIPSRVTGYIAAEPKAQQFGTCWYDPRAEVTEDAAGEQPYLECCCWACRLQTPGVKKGLPCSPVTQSAVFHSWRSSGRYEPTNSPISPIPSCSGSILEITGCFFIP